MPIESFRLPEARSELRLSVLLGAGMAVVLFVLMALAQMMGKIEPPKDQLEESLVAYAAPEIEEIEDEPPPPPEEEEPLPEDLAEEPPQLSLDQLEIALNPGTGGSLAGDFSLPTIGTSARDLGTEDFVDFSDLDQIPRPIGVTGFNFPRRLKRKAVRGRVVLLIRLSPEGDVVEATVDSSTLPDFSDFVRNEVARWRFTPPTKNGQPVKAKARLPIPININ